MKKMITAMTAAVMLASVATMPTAAVDTTYSDSISSVTLVNESRASTPARVTIKNSYGSGTNTIRVKWNKVSGASGYRVYRYNPTTKKWKKVKTLYGQKLEYRDSGLSSGTRYRYKVKAFKKVNGKTIWGESSKTKYVATKPAKMKLKAFSASTNAVRLNWNTINCEGYQIYQLQSNGKYTKIATINNKNTGTYRVSGLKSGSKYTFKIRAFTKDGAGRTVYNTCAKKAKSTKEETVVWTEVDKAYYHMACGYPTEKQCALVRQDIVDYIMKNYSSKKSLVEMKEAYYVFHSLDSQSFNPITNKFEEKPYESKYQISDAHCEHCIMPWDYVGSSITPLKNGYTNEHYEVIQEMKKEIYEWLGYDAIFNSVVSGEETLYFNIGIEYSPDSACAIDDSIDYYDDKDPWHIPTYTIWFCNRPNGEYV